ncbi:ABC transporter permease [Litoreibacter roseus]|uniref:ABC transporter permease n=1 Tax=Litoreibacter roseus TaxID=2601869 RepID=A0A6N6JI41_9RHOB|nr:ABC transporter permease [Litoreibacter roseus]GFE64958.1 ABC transporter permease [Litoreibacter roseus]
MYRSALSALLAHWMRHKLQLFSLIVGLALATALWSGVQAINSEARDSYDRAASALGQDQLERLVMADGSPVPVSVYAELRRAGWRVSPVIEGSVDLAEGSARLVGIDPLTAPPQANAPALTDEDDPTRFLIEGLLIASPELAPRIPAELGAIETSSSIAVDTILTDISTAAERFGQTNPSYLLVAATQPADLPPLSEVASLQRVAGENPSDIARLTDSFHLNLTAFGLLSFAVGLFIVHAAIGLAFEQRRATFRTLRALGVPLRSLITLLAVELATFAIIAGLIGIALGYAIAAALLPNVAGTLRGLYGADVTGQLNFDALWAAAALGISLAGAAIAGAQALSRVARLPILAPAQPRAWARASAKALRRQSAAAAGLLALSVALAIFGSSLLAGFACLACLLVGAALALPGLLTWALDQAARFGQTALGEWLFADTRQQVPGLSLALMALLLALAANIGVGTMVGSFRGTFTGWLDQRLAAELYVSARSEAQAEDVRAFLEPRSDALLPIWSVETRISGLPAEVFGIVDHETYRNHWPLLDAEANVWDRIADGSGALINEQLARRDDLSPGDVVELEPSWTLPVVGIYSDYGNPSGQAIVADASLEARHPDIPKLRLAVRVDPEDAPALAEALRARFDLPGQGVINQDEIKQFSMNMFEQTFRVTGALNVLTLGVAAFAMLASLLTLASMRLPQLAPVWALGLTRAKLARFELARTLILALLTWVISIPVGLLLAWVLLSVVNVEAFGWKLPMEIFPSDWFRLGGLALLAACLATLWPIRSLARTPPSALLKVFAHER